MSSIRLLEHLLELLNSTSENHVLLAQSALRAYSQSDIDVLLATGILQPASESTMALCPGCEDECVMPVELASVAMAPSPRRFILCDRREDIGRVWVQPEHTLQWQVCIEKVLSWLCTELSCTLIESLVDDSLWDLGQGTDVRFHYFLCLGNLKDAMRDNPFVRATIVQTINPIVFCVSHRQNETSDLVISLPLHRCVLESQTGIRLRKELLSESVHEMINSQATNDSIFLNSQSHSVTHLGQEYRLEPRLFQLLHSIVSQHKSVISKDEIEKAMNADYGSIPVEQYLSKINRVLRSQGATKDDLPIEAITGKGYRLKSRYRFIAIT